jgi:hypothetical protein
MPQPKQTPKSKTPLTIDTNIQSSISSSIPSVSSPSPSPSPSIHLRSISNFSIPQSKQTPYKLRPRLNMTTLQGPFTTSQTPQKTQQEPFTTSQTPKKKRCPNGSRRNKRTGECDKKIPPTIKRCPNGTRKNKITGKCEPK